jgi:hypothetical protein
MAIARRITGPTKRERTANHIERLQQIILASYPDAEFEVGPVPESRWTGLWVHADIDDSFDLYDLLREEQDRFFLEETMDVHVIVLGPKENGT